MKYPTRRTIWAVLGLLALLAISLPLASPTASADACAPTPLNRRIVYYNYIQTGDMLVAFTYNIPTACSNFDDIAIGIAAAADAVDPPSTLDPAKILGRYAHIQAPNPVTATDMPGGIYLPTAVSPLSGYRIFAYHTSSLLKLTGPGSLDPATFADTGEETITTTHAGSIDFSPLGTGSLASSAAQNIPILNVIMASSPNNSIDPAPNLATGVGVDAASGFIFITIVLSLALMIAISRVTQNSLIVLLVGLSPVMFMTVQGLVPSVTLIATSIFYCTVAVWQLAVKQQH